MEARRIMAEQLRDAFAGSESLLGKVLQSPLLAVHEMAREQAQHRMRVRSVATDERPAAYID